jgi:HSP20 family protein
MLTGRRITMSDTTTTTRNGETGTAVAPAPTTKPRRWDPLAMFADMEAEMERFFGRSLPVLRPWGQLLKPGSTWAPSVDVYEKDGKLVIKAELPGVDKEDVDLTLDNGDLVIRGERSSESEVNEEAYYRMERYTGTFYRRLPLPVGTQATDISADYKDGVLTVAVNKPRAEVSGATKVAIS